jgi:hypothetical protein
MHANLDPETEREHIRLATEIITRCVGSRPEGWYTRYAPSLSTRAILLDAGYSYDSDAYDDELSYWVKVGSRDQLVVPYSLVHNDVRFSRQGITTGNDYFDYITNAVQCVIDEDPPRMPASDFTTASLLIRVAPLDWQRLSIGSQTIPRCGSCGASTSQRIGANGIRHRALPDAPRRSEAKFS